MRAEVRRHLRAEKNRLRGELRTRRSRLDAEEYAHRSAAIVDRLKHLPEITQARTVHTFWPMTERREADIRPLIAWLYTHEKQIVLPAVVAGDEAVGQTVLEHRFYSGEDALVRNRWGVHEPQSSPPADLRAVDVVLVPAIAAGRNGHRLGYGKGHYDRFLRGLDVPAVCPVFDFCLIEEVPAEPHDTAVSVVVTEGEVWRPTSGS